MIGSTNLTHMSVRMLLCMYICCYSNQFHKRYSKLGVEPHTLLKISFTSIILNRSTNVTQNSFHKYYLRLVPQTLVKIGSTNVAQKLVLQTLLKTVSTNVTYDWFHKRYSCVCAYVVMHVHTLLFKLVSKTLLKIRCRSTHVTQNQSHKFYSKQIHKRY